jgi:hypothetical protein
MRTYDDAVADQALLLAAIQSKAFARLDWTKQDDVLSMATRAGANIECYAAFEQAHNRESFLQDAYRLHARAWLRLQRVIVIAAAALALAAGTTAAAPLPGPTDCYPIDDTSEGFPRVECIDGSRWYQDLDGRYGNDGGQWVRELPALPPR